MLLINCQNNFILTFSASCVISEGNRVTAFAIIDTKLYIPAATLSTHDNTKSQQKLKSGFNSTINWNKYQLKVTTENQDQYLDYLIDPIFQGVKRLFVLSFEGNAHRTRHARYFLPKENIKDYNVMIDGENVFD